MPKDEKGFTLIETIIAIAVFGIIATAVYFSYANILDVFAASYLNLTAVSALDSELETIRNMPYVDVGTEGGSPSGILPAEKDIIYGGVPFKVASSVRNVDDPFDGVQGGSPDDSAPADYKKVEVEIGCPSCSRFIKTVGVITIVPPGLETVTNYGTLIIKALDASGQPISGANVSVTNNSITPPINLISTTDTEGILRLVDIATSSAGYSISVTKSGYSTDRTYPIGGITNPNPIKPDATVLEQEVTEVSFIIDRTSVLNIKTRDEFCSGVPNIDVAQIGQKLIGTNPSTVKYSAVHVTDSGGNKTVGGLEFDAYDLENNDGVYQLAGSSGINTLIIDPNSSYNLDWLMVPELQNSILVSVNNDLGQPINDAKITISKTGFSESDYAGRKRFAETDWSGENYSAKSSNTAIGSGIIELESAGGKYASLSDEWLISKTVDFGNSNTIFYNLYLNPESQPANTTMKIQIAANNDNATWNFIGPDGTANSYYTSSNVQVNQTHNGKRYLRYKIFLRTENELVTPSFDDISIEFHSDCIPDGQAYFDGLDLGTYTITIEKAGYQNFADSAVVLDNDWEIYKAILLTP